ncbi:peptidoglycan-binding protein [Ruegeria sp. 2205SS24-7]|uniref:peptidoglycan-binding domain-containing protein n=1 Tax=Ruegeria discodermiae TaxID=3064389 RepID=UPI0027403C51|nr:peptidoglycan-binding protein [Ruegeria sp. 2205SS24-7]MDP5218761.1 peptidoglycan-binding protein [Ruegeria sp. 2205SS24-7]
MAALKKGAKGKEVETLQKRLNTLGAKPPLVPDSDFGPKTHKALVAFQKKSKLRSTNGVVDKHTSAALKIGGPLPTMNVKPAGPATQNLKDFRKHNLLLQGHMTALKGASVNLTDILDKRLPGVEKMTAANGPLWEKVFKKTTDLVGKQKKFDAILLSDPVQARKISSECDTLLKDMLAIFDKMDANIMSVYTTLDKMMADLNKGVATVQKMMSELKAHTKRNKKFF